jgi:hypothetical protein
MTLQQPKLSDSEAAAVRRGAMAAVWVARAAVRRQAGKVGVR